MGGSRWTEADRERAKQALAETYEASWAQVQVLAQAYPGRKPIYLEPQGFAEDAVDAVLSAVVPVGEPDASIPDEKDQAFKRGWAQGYAAGEDSGGEPDDRLTKLEAAAKDAMEALDEYLRGESGLPFAQPYPAARKAWERLNGALPDG